MKRRTLKRRNPMASVVRKLKPKRIPSARDYRRTDKHRKPLRDHDQSEAVFVCVGRIADMRDRQNTFAAHGVQASSVTTIHRTDRCQTNKITR